MITYSFKDLYTAVQNFMQDTSAGTLTIIKNEINAEYESLARASNWPELRGYLNEVITFTAGEAYLSLPADAAELMQISNKTQDYTLINKNFRHAVSDRIDSVDTNGQVIFYSELGLMPVRRPLSVDSKLELLSSSGADTTQTIRLTGLRASELIIQSEEVTLNGTTAVLGTLTFRRGWSLQSIGTDTSPAGFVTIREEVSDTILAYLPIGEKFTSYYVVHLENPPDAADALNIIYKKRVKKLTDDDDVTIVPVGSILIERVKAKMRQYDRKYLQANIHNADAGGRLSALLSERKLQGNEVRQARPLRWDRPTRAY